MSMPQTWMIRITVHRCQDTALYLPLGQVEDEEVALRELGVHTTLLYDGTFGGLVCIHGVDGHAGKYVMVLRLDNIE